MKWHATFLLIFKCNPMSEYQIKKWIVEGINKNQNLNTFLRENGILVRFINNTIAQVKSVIDKYPIHVDLHSIILKDMQSSAVIALAFQWDNTEEKSCFWTEVNNNYYNTLQS